MAGNEPTQNIEAPLFSVIIPVYNRARVLARAVQSVQAQSCQDFEIVIIDDGSNDNPRAVIAAIDDPRIRIIRQDNRGGGAARNHGFDAARGRFVALLDSDDRFLPQHLENMRHLLEHNSGVVGYAKMVVDRGNGVTLLKPPRAIHTGEHMADYLLCDRGFVPTITLVLERETAKRVRYGEGWRAAEDTDFAIRLFLDGCRFEMIEEPGAVWDDSYDPDRTSAGRKGARLIPWLDQMKPQIPAKAFYGCRGWAIAKGVVADNPLRALRFYLSAVLRGCYRPRLAAIVFLQIFLPDSFYRRIADRAIPLVARTNTTAQQQPC
ncbi:MAG TPA: glycosyltransferase family 2 protein [Rhizomicrobium sp.]